MQPRRSLRLVAGALVLALPLLGGCGFDKATDRPYTPGVGTNDQDGDVDVLSAVVVAAQAGSGTFLASLSNNSSDSDAELDSVAGSGSWSDLVFSDIASPVQVPARGFVNLVDETPITVEGEFGAGDFVELSLTFASGDVTTMNVPVVYACNEYAGLDASASAGPSTSPEADADADAEESESPSSEESASTGEAAGEPYDCGAVLEEE